MNLAEFPQLLDGAGFKPRQFGAGTPVHSQTSRGPQVHVGKARELPDRGAKPSV